MLRLLLPVLSLSLYFRRMSLPLLLLVRLGRREGMFLRIVGGYRRVCSGRNKGEGWGGRW